MQFAWSVAAKKMLHYWHSIHISIFLRSSPKEYCSQRLMFLPCLACSWGLYTSYRGRAARTLLGTRERQWRRGLLGNQRHTESSFLQEQSNFGASAWDDSTSINGFFEWCIIWPCMSVHFNIILQNILPNLYNWRTPVQWKIQYIQYETKGRHTKYVHYYVN